MDGETVYYGLNVKDLQENVKISGRSISGILRHVTNYSQFSSDPEEQNGNFLALSFDCDGAEKIETKVINGDNDSYVDLTDDKYCVYRIQDNENQRIAVRVTKDGESEVIDYELSGLVLQQTTVGEKAFNAEKVDFGGFGKNSEFYDAESFSIEWDGTKATASGTLKNVPKGDSKRTEDGHFYAFALNSSEYQGKEITVENGETVKSAIDTDWVCKISEKTKSGGLKVKCGKTLIADFDFNGVTLA